MIWSCLQGIMGEVWADETLSSAKAVLGDFCFFAGKYHPIFYVGISNVETNNHNNLLRLIGSALFGVD